MREAILAAIAVALAAALIFGLGRDPDATEEQAARLAAEARADSLEAERDSLLAQRQRDSLATARQDSILADSIRAIQERRALDVAAAENRTERLRVQLTAQQQRELDEITTFWREANEEADSEIEALNARLDLARAEAAAERTLRIRETERADAWKDAYDAAKTEIETLRKKDVSILGFGFNVGCTGGVGASYDAIPRDDDERRLSAGPSVTCGVSL